MQQIQTIQQKEKEKEDEEAKQSQFDIYNTAPEMTISLDELEELCLKRLTLLKSLELKFESIRQDQVGKEVLKLTGDQGMRCSGGKAKPEQRTNDIISHFLLRLAFCRTEDLRTWFLTQEARLFQIRLADEHEYKSLVLNKILDQFGVQVQVPESEELFALRDKLESSFQKKKDQTFEPVSKVRFVDGFSLISHRGVYLQRGMIYLQQSDLLKIAAQKFKAFLSAALMETSKELPNILKDQKLAPILLNLSSQHFAPEFGGARSGSSSSHSINLSDIDFLSQKSYPPCVRILHNALRSNHHLKHYGRLQYGLFLKGMGLSLQQSLSFWEKEFCKKISLDKYYN